MEPLFFCGDGGRNGGLLESFLTSWRFIEVLEVNAKLFLLNLEN